MADHDIETMVDAYTDVRQIHQIASKPTKFYLAARYSRHPEMQGVRDVLEALGHKVTSRWIDCHTDVTGDHSKSFTPEVLNERPEDCAPIAKHDLEDIGEADAIIFFSESGAPGKGGRFVEWGYAWAIGKEMVLIGPRENVFHTLPHIEHYPDWPHFVMSLNRQQTNITAEDAIEMGF